MEDPEARKAPCPREAQQRAQKAQQRPSQRERRLLRQTPVRASRQQASWRTWERLPRSEGKREISSGVGNALFRSFSLFHAGPLAAQGHSHPRPSPLAHPAAYRPAPSKPPNSHPHSSLSSHPFCGAHGARCSHPPLRSPSRSPLPVALRRRLPAPSPLPERTPASYAKNAVNDGIPRHAGHVHAECAASCGETHPLLPSLRQPWRRARSAGAQAKNKGVTAKRVGTEDQTAQRSSRVCNASRGDRIDGTANRRSDSSGCERRARARAPTNGRERGEDGRPSGDPPPRLASLPQPLPLFALPPPPCSWRDFALPPLRLLASRVPILGLRSSPRSDLRWFALCALQIAPARERSDHGARVCASGAVRAVRGGRAPRDVCRGGRWLCAPSFEHPDASRL